MLLTLCSLANSAAAQQTLPVNERQFLLNQYAAPGRVAEMLVQAGRANPGYFQPVKVFVPTAGRVTFYDQRPEQPIEVEAPAQAALLLGRLYRFKIDNLPEFPGVEFYPSIELLDRLHPPVGKVDQYPVEFELTLEELDWAAEGRLITKVIYLEQPQRVAITRLNEPRKTETLAPAQNALGEADDRGRPMAIVRLGGRTPDANGMDRQFFGPGGPVRLSAGSMPPAGMINPTTSRDSRARQSNTADRSSPSNPSSGFGTPIVRISTMR